MFFVLASAVRFRSACLRYALALDVGCAGSCDSLVRSSDSSNERTAFMGRRVERSGSVSAGCSFVGILSADCGMDARRASAARAIVATNIRA